MKRLDILMVEEELAPSRTKAQSLIAAGEVQVMLDGEWVTATKPSQLIDGEELRLTPAAQTLKYVSRGGLKLEAALSALKLEVKDFRCLDIGVSTGGFSDCLLQHGARSILAVDVGHDQLALSLRTDPRLQHFEGVNARELNAEIRTRIAEDGIDLCVIDVSFISLHKIIPALPLPKGSQLLALVKPQFEVGPDHLDSNGIVRDVSLFQKVETDILHALAKCGFSVLNYLPCGVKGSDGNQEFFVQAVRV